MSHVRTEAPGGPVRTEAARSSGHGVTPRRPLQAPERAAIASSAPTAFDLSAIRIYPEDSVPLSVQAKLVVGSTDDPLESEADRVAASVLRDDSTDAEGGASRPVISADTGAAAASGGDGGGACGDDLPAPILDDTDEEEAAASPAIRRKHVGGGASATPLPSIEPQIARSRGGGRPLSEPHRHDFEGRFGFDFGRVRIHADGEADPMSRSLGARAFTAGADIYFRQGEFRPETSAGRLLIAHELTHSIQQSRGGASAGVGVIRRAPDKGKKIVWIRYQLLVPASYTTLDQMYRYFERWVYGKEVNHQWTCGSRCDMEKNRGQVVAFLVPRAEVEAGTDPAVKKRREKSQADWAGLPGGTKKAVSAEADRRYYKASGDKPGTKIKPGEEGKARQWQRVLDEVMQDKSALERLPPAIKELITGKGGSYQPKDYEQLLRIARKLEVFTTEDFTVYKLLAIRATDNLDLFEKSVEMYLARKEELKKALDVQAQGGGDKDKDKQEETLRDAFDQKWKSLEASKIGAMSEGSQYDLARQKTSEMTEAQLKYMMDHPGQTLGDFAKSATLLNTPETFSAIGKDLTEAANGDANSWARWAGGVGAGAKLSGWLLAVAGILYVASWLTGIGELATIAAAAAILLGTTLTLSLMESELRIKAASQAKTPEEFKRQVEEAAAARSNVIVGVVLLVLAAVLHFTAKTLFPKQLEAIKVSLKNLREKIRLKGSIYDLKPSVVKEATANKAALADSAELAKKNAVATGTELEGLSLEEFVDRLEKGDGGLLDQSKVPPDQRVDFRKLLETPEGRKAIEGYKQRLVDALKTDVPAGIDRLAKKYAGDIDEFIKDIDAAKNHDDMAAAAGKLEGALGEENAKQFMKGEQDALARKKMEEEAKTAHKEVLKAVLDGIVKRLKERITAAADRFQLTYSDAELQTIFDKGMELGLGAKTIEDLLYTGSRTAKAISAADLMAQMENWAKVVSGRGFPYKFADLAEFRQFSKDLIEAVKTAGLPTDDVRVQGSSLRKPGADDVDTVVFVSESKMAQLLIDRFDGKASFSEAAATPKAKLPLAGKTYAELARLALEIAANESDYNAQARTFMRAMEAGGFNSMSDIFKPLKAAKSTVAGKYPQLNIKTISVQVKGGAFDLSPSMPITGR